MGLGGGTFTSQNKILPGAYINVVSKTAIDVNASDRGIVALPIALSWGSVDQVFALSAEDFKNNAPKLLGYAYSAPEMTLFRDIFKNSRLIYLYRLNQDAVRASNAYATAKYPGVVGNRITISINPNEYSTEESKIWDVSTYFGSTVIETQTVSTMPELKNNDYVNFEGTATLTAAFQPLENGSDGTIAEANHQYALDSLEAYSFNALGCMSDTETIKALYTNYTRRMRDEQGVKFQTIIYQYEDANYEGVVSVDNYTSSGGQDNIDIFSAIFWVLGAIGGAQPGESITNKLYDGEFDVDTYYTQVQLEDAIKTGKFVLHRVGQNIRVLDDINTLTTYTDDKNAEFAKNQTIRALDTIGNSIASIFSSDFLGKIANTADGRLTLWNQVVNYLQTLQTKGVIENFASSDVTVAQGQDKRSVYAVINVTIVGAMRTLYMVVQAA